MRNGVTLIELMIVISIVTIITTMTIHIIKENNPGPSPKDLPVITVGGYNYTVEKFIFEGQHEYYLFALPHNHKQFCIVHDPNCKKCHPVTVEKQNVER